MVKVSACKIHRVAAEQLVRTFTGKHDLHIAAGIFGKEVERNLRGIRQRLVHVILNLRHRVEELICGNLIRDVRYADDIGEVLRIRQLAVFFLLVADGECLDLLRTLGDFFHNIAGIHAGGEEAADLNIGDLVHGDGLRELLCDGVLPVFKRFVVFNLVFDLIVTLHFQFAIFVGEAVCAGQLEDIFKNCALVRTVLVGKVQRDHILVELFFKIRVREKAFDLAAEHEFLALFVVIERLDAENIACTKELFCVLVPNDESKHAAQTVKDFFAVFLVSVQNRFAVCLCGEDVSGLDKLFAKLLIVVNFAVKEQHERAVFV